MHSLLFTTSYEPNKRLYENKKNKECVIRFQKAKGKRRIYLPIMCLFCRFLESASVCGDAVWIKNFWICANEVALIHVLAAFPGRKKTVKNTVFFTKYPPGCIPLKNSLVCSLES